MKNHMAMPGGAGGPRRYAPASFPNIPTRRRSDPSRLLRSNHPWGMANPVPGGRQRLSLSRSVTTASRLPADFEMVVRFCRDGFHCLLTPIPLRSTAVRPMLGGACRGVIVPAISHCVDIPMRPKPRREFPPDRVGVLSGWSRLPDGRTPTDGRSDEAAVDDADLS
jgi:hypothetical protein